MSKQTLLAEFYVTMAQEYPKVDKLAYHLRELIRLARRHARLQEQACNVPMPEGFDFGCECRIKQVVGNLPGCAVLFSGDPRGCTVKLEVPSGKTNDWGREGICVPQ